MSRLSYSNGGNGAIGRRMGLRFQSWDNVQEGENEYLDTPKRPGMFSNEEASHGHVCKPIILDADGQVITGIPLSCPPNVKCNVQDYSMDGHKCNDMQCPNEMPTAKGFTGGFPNYANGGLRSGFPPGMFERMSSVGWKLPTYGGDKYMKDWNEEPVARVGWAQPSQNGWGAAKGYPSQNGWGSGQGYPGQRGRPTNYTNGSAVNYMVPGAIDSREAAKRYDGRFIY